MTGILHVDFFSSNLLMGQNSRSDFVNSSARGTRAYCYQLLEFLLHWVMIWQGVKYFPFLK
ncbi:hypothetical protein PDJAM_G00248340 [Pangasius djambal]|uniref:Uncharacterized protein n=1 Tax=Pangasius djambal TaxID=1691987 RepID=A0ACC5YIV9_9TELE|nr:hypothetical protein [Pangasius djambal]